MRIGSPIIKVFRKAIRLKLNINVSSMLQIPCKILSILYILSRIINLAPHFLGSIVSTVVRARGREKKTRDEGMRKRPNPRDIYFNFLSHNLGTVSSVNQAQILLERTAISGAGAL